MRYSSSPLDFGRPFAYTRLAALGGQASDQERRTKMAGKASKSLRKGKKIESTKNLEFLKIKLTQVY